MDFECNEASLDRMNIWEIPANGIVLTLWLHTSREEWSHGRA